MKEDDKLLIETLAKLEANFINRAYSESVKFGDVMVANALDSFYRELTAIKGPFIDGFSLEWRHFVVQLLSGISYDFSGNALSVAIKGGMIETGKLLDLLQKQKDQI